MSFCCGARLICEHFSNCLVVLEVVLRMQWCLFVALTDLGVLEADIRANLSHTDLANDKSAIELLVNDKVFHLHF